jgi:hypothetical protein
MTRAGPDFVKQSLVGSHWSLAINLWKSPLAVSALANDQEPTANDRF